MLNPAVKATIDEQDARARGIGRVVPPTPLPTPEKLVTIRCLRPFYIGFPEPKVLGIDGRVLKIGDVVQVSLQFARELQSVKKAEILG